jgi:hypothetical protein
MTSDAPDSSAKAFRLWHVNRRNEFVRMVVRLIRWRRLATSGNAGNGVTK